jgi:hypothetical protein
VPWQTFENSSSSTFGEYAKRTAPWEVAQPSRCSAGQFYGTPFHLHTPRSHLLAGQGLIDARKLLSDGEVRVEVC